MAVKGEGGFGPALILICSSTPYCQHNLHSSQWKCKLCYSYGKRL